MYGQFYGFSAPPFLLTPDHRFFFESTVHRRAVAHLMFGLNQGEGFIVITGDVGAGKTTLVGHLLSSLDGRRYVAARIVSSQLEGDDMLRMVAEAFGVSQENVDKATLLTRIEQFLVRTHRQGQRSLLLIDEAQNLSIPALEELRMLSNFQVGAEAPLQSFLLGQPQFRRTLASDDLDQLRQRVIASYHLGPMDEAETAEYIRHRLRTVGWSGDPDITPEACAHIYSHTGGVPRRINTFCSRLLLFGFLEDLHRIDPTTVEQVADDLNRETAQVLESRPSGQGQQSLDAVPPIPALPPLPALPRLLPVDLTDLTGRVAAVEAQAERHERMIARALKAAADYFGVCP
ncbi:MAG: XrtA-associated ATPase [Alphaproteobacteria bacterium]